MNSRETIKDNLEELQMLARERTVKTQNIEYDLETLVKKIKKGVIKLNPDYQRNHRWTDTESSKLVESLILNIPIPTVYISQDIDVDEEVDDDIARYSVIDGQQRLTAINGFMTNAYPLKGLEVLELLNGLFYRDLPPFLVRRLEERTIKCLRIDSTVDSQVKYDIFERLNSGSVQLESQELRNAVYRGKFNNLIKELAKNSKLRILMNINIDKLEEDNKVKKMQDIEFVLRYFSFENGNVNFMKKSFKKFLSEQMKKFNKLSDDEINEKRDQFNKVVNYIYDNIGEFAFAKYKYESKKYILQSRFNAAVYDAVIISISDMMREGDVCITKRKIIRMKELFKNEDFSNSINGSTNDKSKIVTRIELMKKVLR